MTEEEKQEIRKIAQSELLTELISFAKIMFFCSLLGFLVAFIIFVVPLLLRI